MPLIVIERHIHHHYPDSEGSTLTPLLRNMMENIMAQLDDLMTVLNAVHDDVTSVLAKVTTLESQLTQLQQTTPPQVDLSAALDLATSIRQQLEGTTAATGDATGATDSSSASTSDTSDTGTSTSDTTGSTDGGDAASDLASAPVEGSEPTGDAAE